MASNQDDREAHGAALSTGRALLIGLLRGFGLALSAAPRAATLYLLLAVVLSLLPVAQVWLTRLVVNGLVMGAGSVVLLEAALYGVTLLVPAGLDPLQDTLIAGLTDRTVGEVDRRVMRAGAAIPDLQRIEGGRFGDELRLLQEAYAHGPRLVRVLPQLWGSVITLVGLLGVLGRLHPLLPVALVAASVPHVLVERRISALKYNLLNERSRPAREMDYAVRVLTAPFAAKELRIFGQSAFFLGRFRERFTQMLAESDRARRTELRLSMLVTGAQALVLAGGFWYVAVQAGAGRLSLGDVALYLAVVTQIESRLFMAVIQYRNAHETALHLGGLFRFLDGAGPSIAVAPAAVAREAPAILRIGVEFRNVGFHYPEDNLTVLRDISALLPAGQVTALVGANGAGKSTLVKLLTRMYDPTEGEILLDGVPVQAYDLASLRQRVAVVYQDFARFALTLRDNIAVGAVSIDGDSGRFAEAVRWAGADAVAAGLPHGSDTMLTRRFEGGVDLSGGEWQKVALARAFVRDAALVILDEPTAALDADAEDQLFQRFRELIAGKTALLISHRFSTVRMADQILVLEDGRIIEAGSHTALVALGGRYATLFELQAGRYR